MISKMRLLGLLNIRAVPPELILNPGEPLIQVNEHKPLQPAILLIQYAGLHIIPLLGLLIHVHILFLTKLLPFV